MAFDGDLVIRVLLQPLGLAVQGLPAILANGRGIGVVENPIADVLAKIADRCLRPGMVTVDSAMTTYMVGAVDPRVLFARVASVREWIEI